MICPLQILVGWSFTLLLAPVAWAISVARPRRIFRPLQARILRFWGRTMLWLERVELRVEGEPIDASAGAILVFNHASLLDVFIMLSLLPDNGVPVVKREVLRYPLIGWAVACMDMLPISRGDSRTAREQLERVARRMQREPLAVLIAPEGTRSRDGRLGRFKLGAFHLALATGVPIVPMVILGASRLMPRGQLCARSGKITVRVLPPVPPRDFSGDNLRDKALDLRARMAEQLAVAEPIP